MKAQKYFERYSPEEKKFILDNYKHLSRPQMASALGRTLPSIGHQMSEMKITRGGKKVWTDAELDQLRNDYRNFSRKQLAEKFNVTLPQLVAAVKNHKINSGRTAHFPKGHVPWIKGKKMPAGWGGVETRFKKGQTPHNKLLIGTIITRKYVDGHRYKWQKISDNQWRQVSHIIYEEKHGPIPPGQLVTFKDGNSTNCAIDNLALESKQEHMARYTIARFPPELISTIHLLSKFKRKVKEYAEKQN